MDQAPVADHLQPVGPPTPTSGGCPFPHAALAAAPAPAPAPVAPAEAARCPVPHVAAAAPASGCPVVHGPTGARRSPADMVVRRILRIPEQPVDLSDKAVYSAFQRSMMISAVRCTLTYIVFPFVLPTLHFLRGGAPVIGLFVGSFALVCDVFAIRRFFAVDHKYRWHFSAIAFAIMCLVSVLWVGDIVAIVRSITN